MQERYVRDVIERFNMAGCKPTSTPLEMGNPLPTLEPTTEKERREMENVPYRSAIGSLMYLATCTRPDLAESVSSASSVKIQESFIGRG